MEGVLSATDSVLERQRAELRLQEIGTATYIGKGVAQVTGLPEVKSEELISFPGGLYGMAFNLDPDQVGVILLDRSENLAAGVEVTRTMRVLDVPVGNAMLGRVVDGIGRPLDDAGPIVTSERRSVERPAPPIMHRDPVTVPLQTGLKVVDAAIPIGRGQSELIIGDRQTGKTAIAVDTIINQNGKHVICIYCAVGQRAASVAKVIADLREHQAMDHTVVMVAAGEDPPGLQFITPYAATALGEYFMEQGRDVLVIYDDLTSHARAYRELSLLLRRPPGREAFPGDIFYIHSRLLERSTHLRPEYGGGSLTALPIVETEAQNMAAYIPTNLISITDGQIYLSPDLFSKGILPPVDVGRSVSRVGGKAQLPAYRLVAGDLRLAYSQFEAMETFARFSTQLDAATQRMLDRGRRVREVLKQNQYSPMSAPVQIATLLAINTGLYDRLEVDQVLKAEQVVVEAIAKECPEVCSRIQSGAKMTDEDRETILHKAQAALAQAFPVAEEEEAA